MEKNIYKYQQNLAQFSVKLTSPHCRHTRNAPPVLYDTVQEIVTENVYYFVSSFYLAQPRAKGSEWQFKAWLQYRYSSSLVETKYTGSTLHGKIDISANLSMNHHSDFYLDKDQGHRLFNNPDLVYLSFFKNLSHFAK